MKYFLTGTSGFAGGHYIEYLLNKNSKNRLFGLDTKRPRFNFLKGVSKKRFEFYKGTALNRAWVRKLLKKLKPDYVINLAALSSVAYSWENPLKCYSNNTGIFLNVVEALRETKIRAKMLSVGSSEVYGVVNKKTARLSEESSLKPSNPYAIARASQECFAKMYTRTHQIPIICTRSFNCIYNFFGRLIKNFIIVCS